MIWPEISKEKINLLSEVFATALLWNRDETGDFAYEVVQLVEEMNLVAEVVTMVHALLTTNSSDRAYTEEEVAEFVREVITLNLKSKQ